MASRDPRTGRFVSTANTRESSEGHFETYTDVPVDFEGADPGDLAYDAVPRHAPDADTLAGPGPSYGSFPLRARNPVMVHPEDEDFHNGIMRSAVRRLVDPSIRQHLAYLTGMETANGD